MAPTSRPLAPASHHTRLADLREPAQLEAVAPLFDAYRQFYGRPGDLEGARAFLRARATRGESVVIVAATDGGEPVGFTQLYPLFSSVAMAPVFVLNDLFVAPTARRLGAGRALLQAAADHAAQASAVRLSLSTAVDNLAAQTLYTAMGWQRDTAFHAYHLPLR